MLAAWPHLVGDYKHAPSVSPRKFPGKLSPDFWPEWGWITRGQGHVGVPANADVEIGKKMLEDAATSVAQLLDDLCDFNPDEFLAHEKPHEKPQED
jgi:creatinine amidohydrolase/Fe(II)-dependent formamide hydrolase-like protein